MALIERTVDNVEKALEKNGVPVIPSAAQIREKVLSAFENAGGDMASVASTVVELLEGAKNESVRLNAAKLILGEITSRTKEEEDKRTISVVIHTDKTQVNMADIFNPARADQE